MGWAAAERNKPFLGKKRVAKSGRSGRIIVTSGFVSFSCHSVGECVQTCKLDE